MDCLLLNTFELHRSQNSGLAYIADSRTHRSQQMRDLPKSSSAM